MHTGAGDATYYSMESSRCENCSIKSPHVWEKLQMLVAGELVRPIDIFDLLLHATPWMLLILKLSLYRSEES
jgi:hypothetical protein